MSSLLKQSPPPSSPNSPHHATTPPFPPPPLPYTHRFQKGLSVQKSKNKVTQFVLHLKMAENLSNASSPLKKSAKSAKYVFGKGHYGVCTKKTQIRLYIFPQFTEIGYTWNVFPLFSTRENMTSCLKMELYLQAKKI